MATTKTLTPTNQTISIPELTDAPDMSVASDAIAKEADAINALNSNKANYLFIDATSYTYDSKAGWDFAYGQIPDGYNGILRINFNGGYNIICTAYRQNSSWGSIIGHTNSNHIPFFYNVQAGTSTLDELALNSNLSSLQMVKISKTVTIPDGTQTEQTVEVDISDSIPSGKSIHSISNIRLTNYILPYISGPRRTWIESINPSYNIIKIKSTSTAWNNYSLTMVAFVQ